MVTAESLPCILFDYTIHVEALPHIWTLALENQPGLAVSAKPIFLLSDGPPDIIERVATFLFASGEEAPGQI